MAKYSDLTKAVKAAMGIAAVASILPVYSYAEEVAAEDDDEIEEVFVTGSRIKRDDFTSASPISVFDSEDLDASGLSTIEDFVQNMPSMNGGSLGSTVNNGNRGFATAALRGLGSGRTLILIDGYRPATSDMNMIPLTFVERVEILRDGASTIYGTDAVAGVVNFITKKNFSGSQFNYQWDLTDKDDGKQERISFIAGGEFNGGHATVGVEYSKRDAIGQGDRDFSACPKFDESDAAGNPTGNQLCGGSGHSYPAHIYANAAVGPAADGYVLADNGTLKPWIQEEDAFNYSALSYMVTPQEVFSIYGNTEFELVSEGFTTVSAFAQTRFGNRKSDQLMAPVATFWGPAIGAAEPFNPTGEDINISRRLVETGGRAWSQDFNNFNIIGGLKGELENEWTWDTSFNYSTYSDARVVAGQINQPRMALLLDSAACTADADCLEATGNVGYWNPFLKDSLTEDMINYATVTHSPVVTSKTKQFQINVAGDSLDFELPGGQILWAAGYENRYEDYLSQPDGAAALGQIYFVAGDKTEGSFDVEEFYGEVNFPVLSGITGVHELNIETSFRQTDYSYLSSSETTSKIGVDYAPIEDVRFRAVAAQGFRAASIVELFAAQALSANQYNDPCVNWGTSTNQNVRANCAADGLPEDFTLSSTQATAVTGGNPELAPEKSDSMTFGLVITPVDFPEFQATIDYFNIEITDGVGTAGTDNIITGCYESANFSSQLCSLLRGPSFVGEGPSSTAPLRRDSGNNITGLELTNANLSTFETSGVDFNFSYAMDVANGELDLSLAGTYMMQYDYLPFEGEEKVEAAGFVAEDQWVGNPAAFAKLRTNFNVGYTAGDLGVFYTTRYMSETEDINASDANADNIADSIFYHDLQVNYNYKVADFSVGVRNLTDEEAPYISNNDDMNTINQSYDTAGRYMYFRTSVTF